MTKLYLLLILLFSSLALSKEIELGSYFTPAVTTLNTGVERMWVVTGVSGGLTFNNNWLGLELYYWNRDKVTKGRTLQNNFHLLATLYGTWSYSFRPTNFLLFTAGLSLGYQYAEVDKNWDSTFTGEFRVDGKDSSGTVEMSWEAEAKVQSFGGPQVSLAVGKNRIFINARFRVNIGITKEWGSYSSYNKEIDEINCGDGLYVGKVKVGEAGWQSSTQGVLNESVTPLPEIQLGLLIFL